MRDQWMHIQQLRASNTFYTGCTKLMLTHWDKKNYVIHGRLLQFYMKHGMIVSTVHRVIKFQQSPIFRKYIEYNSSKRQQATKKFEKDFYKLKNNNLYGKTDENKRRRMNFKLCYDTNMHMKFIRLRLFSTVFPYRLLFLSF